MHRTIPKSRSGSNIQKSQYTKKINLYILTILGCASELQSTQDHGTGRHGSPPSCAQSVDEYCEMKLAIAAPATHTNPASLTYYFTASGDSFERMMTKSTRRA